MQSKQRRRWQFQEKTYPIRRTYGAMAPDIEERFAYFKYFPIQRIVANHNMVPTLVF
jgi:hypothetical protein